MPKHIKQSIVNDAVNALNSVRREWLRRPGVTAVDIGYKIKDRELTDDVAVRMHVGRKRPVAELPQSEVVNESGKAPKKVGGFPVDVIEAEYGPSQSPIVLEDAAQAVNRKERLNPLVGGISVGNPRITAGTLSAIVFDKSNCKAAILSNWHVLAGDMSASAGEPIYQPGKSDGGTSADTVATLARFVLDSRMDAGIAHLNGDRSYDREILDVGTVSGMSDPTLGMLVVKSGRTTEVTEGVIDGLSMSVSINYGGSAGAVTLNNQIHIVPRPPWPSVDYEVSKGGDSGSLWMEQSSNKAIGLHFAGETDPAPSAENAIANPIKTVADELNFSFLPVLCRRPPVFDLCRSYPALCRIRSLCERFPLLCRPVVRKPIIPIDPGPLHTPVSPSSGISQAREQSMLEGLIDEQAIAELLDLLNRLEAEG